MRMGWTCSSLFLDCNLNRVILLLAKFLCPVREGATWAQDYDLNAESTIADIPAFLPNPFLLRFCSVRFNKFELDDDETKAAVTTVCG